MKARKFWWKCKSIVRTGCRVEDKLIQLIDGSLESYLQDSWHFHSVKWAIGGSGVVHSLNLLLSSEWVNSPEHGGVHRFIFIETNASARWATFGRQNWYCEMNQTSVLMQCPWGSKKGVSQYRQQDDGHGSQNQFRNV